MHRYLVGAITLIIFLSSCSGQNIGEKLNLNFEKTNLKQELPDGWMNWGSANYFSVKDTVTVYEGSHSVAVSLKSDLKEGTFGSVAFPIPSGFAGKEITLEGYMKTEKVVNGFSGLFLRIDGDGRVLEFDNMQTQNINGTNDWKKYSITLPNHEEAKQIFIGGILTGEGKVWFDNFEILIDGQTISNLKTVESGALSDKEFDNGSKIRLEELSEIQIQRIAKLAKVWGFVKYHHPNVAAGKFNFDYELFRVLPIVLKDTTELAIDNEIGIWVSKFGVVFNIDNKKNAEIKEIKLSANNSWIRDTALISKNLRAPLLNMESAQRNNLKHYYIGFAEGIGNPVFKNEAVYDKMDFSDDGYKLLSLFRYWNMIQYFFPYRYLIDENWDAVLKTFIPRMVEADGELEYKLALLDLIGKVQDSHANVWQGDPVLANYFGNKAAPIELALIDNKAVIVRILDGASLTTGIKVGDIITHIDGKEVMKLVEEKIRYCPGSNEPTRRFRVAQRILRTNNDELTLTLSDKKNVKIECVDFKSINLLKVDMPSHRVIDGDVGYIYPASLKKDEITEIMERFKNTKGIIIDFRCYPSDFIAFSVNKYLLSQPTDFAKFSVGSLSIPGQFSFTPPVKVGSNEDDPYKGKIIIIVNEKTISQAEYTTMALRVSKNALVIGSTTSGADGDVSQIVLPGKVLTMISGIGVYYPNGNETQRIGIIPDIRCSPTIKGIKAGKDELLDLAIKTIH